MVSAISAALTEDHFGEWLALDFYRLVIGVIIVGIGVGKLTHQPDVEHVLLNLRLGERLLWGLAALPGAGAGRFFGWKSRLSSCWRSCRICSGVRPLMLLRSWLKSLCVIVIYE